MRTLPRGKRGPATPTITATDIARMRGELLFDGPEAGRKLSRFWALMVLSAIIASAGVVADSTATVIGAMIVAPLMTPIIGTVFSLVTADLRNAARCVALLVAGAATVVAIGWVIGLVISVDVVAATNSQVSGRVHPRLIDLLAALATGAVGAFALVRPDVSDTLPGVAIAISLVPPLAVVGLTLESDVPGESRGALLLFLTNVGAIVLSGLVVMALYRIHTVASRDGRRTGSEHRIATVVATAAVLVIAVPLAVTGRQISQEALRESDVTGVSREWASTVGWEVLNVVTDEDDVVVRATGPLPLPDPRSLRAALDRNGLRGVDVRVELTPSRRVELPGH